MSAVSNLLKQGSTSPSTFRLRPSILLFGDSITEYGFGRADSSDVGWAGLLSVAYTRRCDVLNRGFAGYNTRLALEVLPRVFGDNAGSDSDSAPSSSSPSSGSSNRELLFCTVFFGANDAVAAGEPQHVPIVEYAANLDTVVREIRTRSSATGELLPIFLLTPPPIDEAAWAAWRQIETSDRSNDVARLYGAQVKEVAAAHEHCSVVDTWELLHGNGGVRDRGLYLSDGLHLNEAGNRLVYRGLMDVLQKDYPHLAPMSDEDGEGRYGTTGIPKEEKLWKEL